MKSEWNCPKCGAGANEHGAGGRDKCNEGATSCQGFICECDPRDNAASEQDDHGTSLTNPCREANCYHCGWGGTFPKNPKGLQTWEKKALDAGWTMPEARAKELVAAMPSRGGSNG